MIVSLAKFILLIILQIDAHKKIDENVDIDDIAGRLETAKFQNIPNDTKEYVANSANLTKRPRMDSGDTAQLMTTGRYYLYAGES
jgi:hypothetical protein